MKMNYKERVLSNLKFLFSKKGYNITFNKKHPEYKSGITFNGNNNPIILATEYFTLAVFVVLSIILGIYSGFKSLIYIPIISIVPINLILALNTSKFHEIIKKYEDNKGTSSLLELNLSFVPPIIMIGIVLDLKENQLKIGLGLSCIIILLGTISFSGLVDHSLIL